jgi:UDP:flavonoid glycosyltransferase YjiC (YdhE family)
MRILFASTAGAGHFGPMVPFIRSALRGGHDVLVAGPPALGSGVAPTGATFWAVDAPPREEMAAVYEPLPSLSREEANALVISEIFGRLDATAALPRLREAITDWRPDLVLRESAELGSAVAAELHGVPHARIGIGLTVMERVLARYAGPNLDALRTANGLPSDPGLRVLTDSPFLTLFPAGLEDPTGPGPAATLRFRDPEWANIVRTEPADRPFVYLTFGSVVGSLPHATVFAEAVAAVTDLDAEVLLTVGQATDLELIGTPPPHVRVERWVDQLEVLGRAAAVVNHGGGGTVLGALAAGVPQVVVPLFASDQFLNAERLDAVGAGRLVTPAAEEIRAALDAVLTEPPYRDTAVALAAELAGQPDTDEFPALLAERKLSISHG